ncbi:MAG: hypothetical protein AAB578_06070 [Elusimicrobiota bacterium]
MIQKIADIFDIPDLRRRVLFTLGCLAVYRVGAAIPIPGINGEALRAIFQAQASTLLGILLSGVSGLDQGDSLSAIHDIAYPPAGLLQDAARESALDGVVVGQDEGRLGGCGHWGQGAD